jgi:predicted nucleic acid-binding protein
MKAVDTNIAVYALSDEASRERAGDILLTCDFASIQLLIEHAHSARRKLRRDGSLVNTDVALLQAMIGDIKPIGTSDATAALRLAERYQLCFFDALHLAVALAGGATIFYSENMQHGLIIDDRMTIINPFLPSPIMDAA